MRGYAAIDLDGDLVRRVEQRTDDLGDRDEWIREAVEEELRRDRPEPPADLDGDEYRRWLVERAIRGRLGE